jgi:hypothetical protein
VLDQSSGSRGEDCVEVASLGDGHCAIRDSKDPAGRVLIFTPAGRAAFAAGVDAGECA